MGKVIKTEGGLEDARETVELVCENRTFTI
jgi:hypothetical protein